MPSGLFVPLVTIGGAAVVLMAVFAILFLRLASRFNPEDATLEWLDDFKVESYAPMERLLDATDFEFLAVRCPGRPELRKQLLSERRSIFREYLGLLVQDFNQLHSLAKLMLVHAPLDRPELAHELLRQQLRFYWSVTVVRCKVFLYPLGWTALDVPKLLHVLERMRSELRAGITTLVPDPNA